MSSPDFSIMTEQELRAYVLSHRQDGSVIDLFILLKSPSQIHSD